jgi:hypothetical protein
MCAHVHVYVRVRCLCVYTCVCVCARARVYAWMCEVRARDCVRACVVFLVVSYNTLTCGR